jgi:serine protease Do
MKALKLTYAFLFAATLQTWTDWALAAGSVYQIAVSRSDGGRAAGSAVQIAPGRLIASCHTVRDASEIVVMHPEKQFPATLERADFLHDVCLLAVRALNGRFPERVPSTSLRVGLPVIAYGYGPNFSLSMARGTITALHRYDGGYVLRISARFPRGASGGGLFDAEARLVGILTFSAPANTELNYAVPNEWVDRLLEGGSPTQNATAFWEDSSVRQPVFLRAARMEYEAAWQDLRTLAADWIATQEDDVEAWLALGRAEIGLGKEEQALTALQRAAALQPNNAKVWYRLASAYRLLGLMQQFEDAQAKLTMLDSELAVQLQNTLPNGGTKH